MSISTLCLHTGGIGDFVLACPTVAFLAQDGPVTLAGRRERLALAVAAGLAVEAHDLDAIGFESVFSEPSRRLREFLALFSRAVIWMRDDDRCIATALRACGVADVACFPGLPPESWTRHASDYYAQCVGAPPPGDAPCLRGIPAYGPPLDVVIHPGSGSVKKNWPTERYVALAAHLEARGREVVWCRGPAEEHIAYPADAVFLDAPDLTVLAGRLRQARLYIGNDSGITHLAAAVGCPVAALFGATDPRVWAPRGQQVRVVSGAPWPDFSVVCGALEMLLER